jgi:hypothetical protein
MPSRSEERTSSSVVGTIRYERYRKRSLKSMEEMPPKNLVNTGLLKISASLSIAFQYADHGSLLISHVIKYNGTAAAAVPLHQCPRFPLVLDFRRCEIHQKHQNTSAKLCCWEKNSEEQRMRSRQRLQYSIQYLARSSLITQSSNCAVK